MVTRILRDEKTPIIAFVANTGGLMGLCMGFSLVSVFEILYHMSGAFRRKMTEMNLNNTTLNGGHENNSELKELKPKVNQNGVPKGMVVFFQENIDFFFVKLSFFFQCAKLLPLLNQRQALTN